MSTNLVVTVVAAGHGTKILFSDLSFVLAPGDVLGLIGPNGAGKTTLLQLLAGLTVPQAGAVSRSPPTATVGYLPQERGGVAGETVQAFLARRTGVTAAEQAMNQAAEDLGAEVLGAEEAYSAALESWLSLGGADLPDRVAGVCTDVGLAMDPTTPMSELSGGESARAGLASMLLSRFDIVLLDEPTNDLDLAGLERLERFVAALRVGAVIVSHDREFLSRTVTAVLELDSGQHKVRYISGGYDAYLAERQVQRRHERQEYEQYADTLSALGQRAQMQRAWMEKGVANARRKAPDNDKIGRKFRSEATEKQASKARQTDRMIERLEQVDEPRKEWQLRMEIPTATRSGAVAATANSAVVHRGDFTLGPVSLQVNWADRVVITGANGAGKSTLLALLLGRLRPDAGSAALGPGVIVGEVDQVRQQLSLELPLVQAVAAQLPELADGEVRTLLAKFGLRSEHVQRPTANLSPGERTRAALALLQARKVNLLVLDEPTNHLDLPAIEQLEVALETFAGTVLLVSHDRQLLQQVRSTRSLVVHNGQVSEG